MVSWITRRPAKPMSAPGSATMTSPSMANDAVTPPVVGSVRTEKYGSPARPWASSAAAVLAICMSEARPSCMRAPPLAQKMITGSPWAVARSTQRAIFSPTTLPIEPIMKLLSITHTATRSP